MSKKCIFCGAPLNDDALFCSSCGKKQENTTAGDQIQLVTQTTTTAPADDPNPAGKPNETGPKKKKYTIPIAAAVIVVVLLFLSSIGRSSSSPNDTEADVSADIENVEDIEGIEDIEEAEDTLYLSEAENELISYIDQAESLVQTSFQEIYAISNEDGDKSSLFQRYADTSQTILSNLSSLEEQANAVSGVDAALKNAAKEYFTMENDLWNGFYEGSVFMSDYEDFAENVVFLRPQADSSDTSMSDYYKVLGDWYESVKEGYAAITTCPPCLETEWAYYGEILDLNENIANKAHWASYYNDILRWQSVINMSERYTTSLQLQYDKFFNCLMGEMNHVDMQLSRSTALAEELLAYAELEADARTGYEFENIYTGTIIIDDSIFETVDTIYPSLYSTYDAFLIIKTGCISGNKEIFVEAEIPGFTQNYKQSFQLDSSYTEIKIKPPALTGSLDLTSAKDAQIQVTITEKDGTPIVAKSFLIKIKSKYDFEWISDEYGIATNDNILCFLTPESSAILELKRTAIEEISNISDGSVESFVGYQGNPWNNNYVGTYLQAAGIMQAMYDLGVRYNKTSFSISNSNQRILLPADVLEERSGLCIETSLVVASALQAAGMHAFIVLPPGHAQVAVEVWNGSGEDKRGTGNYLLIETTDLSDNLDSYKEGIEAFSNYKNTKSGPIVYKSSESWEKYLAVEGTYLIDCDDSRVLGLTPFVN